MANKIRIDVPLGNIYESAVSDVDHIYEELEDVSHFLGDRSDLPKKSIFEGASKDEILEYLEDAKERVDVFIGTEDINTQNDDVLIIGGDVSIISPIISTKNLIETSISTNRRNRTSNVSNSSTDSTATTISSIEVEDLIQCNISGSPSAGQLVERNDSGVGAETSKPCKLRRSASSNFNEVEHLCTDCEQVMEPNEDEISGLLYYPLVCTKCEKKRNERKEIISEFVDTEFKYGRDLRIIREEFMRPIEVAGLLTKDQLKVVFLNLDELIAVNSKFSEKLQDAIDIATEQGDEDFTTVNIGKLFMESSAMLHSFETYCVRQSSASLLLNHLEKEKELLRIFLRVSQMENTLLRRMNLSAFLMVPVQRVTKYPLLLNRLYKVTPYHHRDREAVKAAQQKVELHLEHINQQTKGIGASTKIWRRISNLSASNRRLNNIDDIGNIRLRQTVLDILNWCREESQFVLTSKLFYLPMSDNQINKKGRSLKFVTVNAALVTSGKPNNNYRPDLILKSDDDGEMMFPRDTGIADAVLLLLKEKSGRFVPCRSPLHLRNCVFSTDSDSDDMFEVHEQNTKDYYLFKGDSKPETDEWFQQLRYHSKSLGQWRRRRNALANIMVVKQ